MLARLGSKGGGARPRRPPWRSGFVPSLLANAALLAIGRPSREIRLPMAACYQLTYRCQLDCCYCREHRSPPSDAHGTAAARHGMRSSAPRAPDPPEADRSCELDSAGAVATIRALRQICDVIDFSGGEPLARCDLEELLGEARTLGFREIVLNTNGLGLMNRPGLLRHVHAVMLGLDTLRAEPFERITGGSRRQWQEQLETLRALHRLQREHGFDLEICTVLVPGELDEVEPILRWCFDHDVLLSVSPQIDASLEVSPALRADPRYHALTARLLRDRQRGRPLLGPPSYYRGIHELNAFRCLPLSTLTVGPGGELLWPCGEIQLRGPRLSAETSFRSLSTKAEAALGPARACQGRCHFSCRMALPLLAARPWELASEARQWLRYRRYRR